MPLSMSAWQPLKTKSKISRATSRVQDRPNSGDGVKVIKLSDEELATIRSTLQSNSAIAASASAMAGRKILILVDPPGVCFDYSNF